ncbi:MAG: hypothetical protein COT74_11925 [Bdellovibrionales bacterium CG10_big_fil_rev_8_21_14_0_10_45_34]|nr:MAG: hypothetical protein COT74_11925 [Bdellovibrionales bacterium CG10_big_fil_rev_8_21_14_0_10_45_34]
MTTQTQNFVGLGLLICTLWLGGCAPQTEEAKKSNKPDLIILNGNSDLGDVTSITAQPLGPVSSRKTIGVEFSLQDAGSVQLCLYCDRGLSKGYSLTFNRVQNELHANLLSPSGVEHSISSAFSLVNASTKVSLQIDFDNQGVTSRLIVSDSSGTNMIQLYDSENGGDTSVLATGNYLGIKQIKARLESLYFH